jgi:hypothetical protein
MNNIIDPVAISSITLTSHLLVYFNSSINPVIYNFMSGSYLCYIIWLSDNLSSLRFYYINEYMLTYKSLFSKEVHWTLSNTQS